MATADIFALQHSDLNGFLFAELGTESSGNRLSVLSAFARLDLDPWQEGSRLSRLPRAGAVASLVSMFERVAPDIVVLGDVPGTAARLVALLPDHGSDLAFSSGVAMQPARRVLSVHLPYICVGVVVYWLGLVLLGILGPGSGNASNPRIRAGGGGADQGVSSGAVPPSIPASSQTDHP